MKDFEEEYIEDGFNVLMRDCGCMICYMCLSEIWMNGGPLTSFPHGEIICTICNRVYSTGLVSADDVEKLSSISNPGIEVDGGWREGVLFLRINGEIDNDDDDAEP